MNGVTTDRAHRWGDNPLPDNMLRSPRLEHMASGRGYGFALVRMWRDARLGKTVIQAHRDGLAAESCVSDEVPWSRAEFQAIAELNWALNPATATAPLDFEIVMREP